MIRVKNDPKTKGKWVVDTGFGTKRSYQSRYLFSNESAAWNYYSSVHTHSGGKKRLYNNKGELVDRQLTTRFSD